MGMQGLSVIIVLEGVDFLEGCIECVDDVYMQYCLWYLQFMYYCVNELGDIQIELLVYGGLINFGVDVVCCCNVLGIVVDVVYGMYDFVKCVVVMIIKLLVLLYMVLLGLFWVCSWLILVDYVCVVVDIGGVIGVWFNVVDFFNFDVMVMGIKCMVDVVGVVYVGLGIDMFGFIWLLVFISYVQLLVLVVVLQKVGFMVVEVGQILGGNYWCVFEVMVG